MQFWREKQFKGLTSIPFREEESVRNSVRIDSSDDLQSKLFAWRQHIPPNGITSNDICPMIG
jgi:hypothetical protein